MADPVIVSSGHTFERNCVRACLSLALTPTLPGGGIPNFTTVIPNLALRSTILNWCRQHHIEPPKPLDLTSAEKFVKKLVPELTIHTPSEEASVTSSDGTLPIPSCYSSSSSSIEIEIEKSNFTEDEEFMTKLKNPQIGDQEEALASIRRLTRTEEESRLRLCTPRLLAVLRSLISSRYSSLQINAVATLVNLSLQNQNKVKIVRSGIVPALIEVLRSGFAEAQDHAAGALFSLSLDDQNKTAIGVLGGLPPLLNSLRSDSERTQHDSAMALYHLSLVQSNRVKLIKLGSIQILIGMVKAGMIPGRVMLILCNMAASTEGRAAMLDGGGVECLVSWLREGGEDGSGTRESCLAAIYGLSYGGLRFRGLAKEARAEEVLMKAAETASERGKEKVRKVLEVLKDKEEAEEEIDWEELLNSSDSVSRTH